MYKSPIELYESEMETFLEGEILKAVKRVGVNVDKDELLKALEYDRGQYEKGYADGLNAYKWIPCSERLPKEDEIDVLVSTKAFGVGVGLYTKRYGYGMQEGFLTNYGFVNLKNAEAWQPLPQPYKEDK